MYTVRTSQERVKYIGWRQRTYGELGFEWDVSLLASCALFISYH